MPVFDLRFRFSHLSGYVIMPAMNRMLHPTLWRTCRVLANPVRLRVLKAVMTTPRAHVTAVQRLCRLPQSSTSHHLRLLQSRGLLLATPVSRYLLYSPKTDPAVGNADPVLAAVRAALERDEAPKSISRALKGLTHARRIAIVRALRGAPATPEQLVHKCQISLPAVYRHLAKLMTCGLIVASGEHTYHLTGQAPALVRNLVAIACSD